MDLSQGLFQLLLLLSKPALIEINNNINFVLEVKKNLCATMKRSLKMKIFSVILNCMINIHTLAPFLTLSFFKTTKTYVLLRRALGDFQINGKERGTWHYFFSFFFLEGVGGRGWVEGTTVYILTFGQYT